jgi:hypothetical protein
MRQNHKTTTLIVAMAVIAATLLAAGTVAVASNHSAFAWKDKGYKKEKYQKDENKYNREDKSDGNNINVNKQYVKCIVVGRDEGHGPDGARPSQLIGTPGEDGHTIGPNSCYAENTNTNNDGSNSPPMMGGGPDHEGM